MPLKSPFPKEVYERNAVIYKLMANPKRLEILNSIKNTRATVNELAELLGVRKANISQHLFYLRAMKLVEVERKGKNAFYTITDPRLVEPCRILKELLEKDKKGAKKTGKS
ncbi:MAG: winged helix-turn-helix transcriptional regulator [Candidatus Taylorbacteria bacterium]|nr:winged helix-turn-helix transcriptional regulator [Candidatus Taylorbacteria bacterium]